MTPYVIEIETPAGRRVLKGTLALTEADAVAGIKHLQNSVGKAGLPMCPRGEIVDVWLRESGRPIPRSLLNSPDAMKILAHFPIR